MDNRHMRTNMKMEKNIAQFIVDVFTDKVFGGNPTAIC